MRALAPLFLVIFLATGCAHSRAGAGQADAFFGPVQTLDGRIVLLSSFLQDRVTFLSEGDKARIRVDSIDYLLLVVGRTGCEWTLKQIEGLIANSPDLRNLRVRTVAVLREEGDARAAQRLFRQAEGVTILRDPGGDCYSFYVRARSPSVNVFDSMGGRLLAVEGFVEPAALVERIRTRDFTEIPIKGG